MNFNRFKKEYQAMANAETPDVPVVPQVTETAKPRLTQRPAFRFAMAALSLLLVVGISLTAVYVVPKSNVSGVVTAEGKPSLTRCASYDDLDALFTQAKDQADSRSIFDGMYYKATTATANRDDADAINYAGEPGDFTLGPIEENMPSAALPEEADGNGYSKTNVQVDGVDEADIVKTDGEFVYVAHDGNVLVFDVRTPSDVKLLSTVYADNLLGSSVYDYAHVADMFLEDDLLTVVFTAQKQDYQDKRVYTDYYFSMRDNSVYGIAVYDVSDPAEPKNVRYYTQEGSYVSSRRIGDHVYIVTLKYVYAGNYNGEPKEVVPCRCDSTTEETMTPIAPDCVYIGENSTNFITLGALNIKDADEPAGTVTVLGEARTVYSSAKAMYLFGANYDYAYTDDGEVSDGNMTTKIYKFTLDGAELAFTASGSVNGYMINQFAADEYEGNLRVATTRDGYTEKPDGTVEFYSDNGITILDENLDKLGELTGLAKGEHIYSVRFNGATGYVVTFRTVDPLFAFDLSDPKNPVVTGELKIPGYSEYLHVYDEDTLLGIGQDAAAESEDAEIAYYQGLKISLFDVGDGEDLSEIDTYILGHRGTYSTAEYDHKALAYYGERDVFGLPVDIYYFEDDDHTIYDYGEYEGCSFCVFSMGGGEKITLVSKIQQLREGAGDGEGKTRDITRGIFIGDNVVTISDDMIQINNYTTGELLSNLTF